MQCVHTCACFNSRARRPCCHQGYRHGHPQPLRGKGSLTLRIGVNAPRPTEPPFLELQIKHQLWAWGMATEAGASGADDAPVPSPTCPCGVSTRR